MKRAGWIWLKESYQWPLWERFHWNNGGMKTILNWLKIKWEGGDRDERLLFLQVFLWKGIWKEVNKEKWKWKSLSCVRLFATPWTVYALNSPGQNTGVGSLSLLQGIFPTQGLNPGLLHRRQILYQLSHKGSPRILQWGAYPFCSGPSRPRNRTGISQGNQQGLPWWSSDEDSILQCRWTCVRSRVGGLRSHTPQARPGTAK